MLGSLFPPVRRSKFFFEDSMVVIQIEDVQFKIHKSKLMESETFADMFTVAKGSNNREESKEGISTHHPIKLKGVSASDFEHLLTLLYERHYTHQHPELEVSLVLPAFRLAHMWNFTELRTYLLPYLEEGLDDVDKIVYAREFDVKEWIIPAYTKLYRRAEPLNSEEAEKLGFKTAMLIFRLREEKYLVTDQRCCGRTMHAQSQLYCGSCGRSRTNNYLSESDKVVEEKINAWEKSGQIFT
ncbi:BTB/POZ domain protein [Rhizoctonia solani AG-3 Rhs1AP]|uniref:BTB/POZ domain protein n=2 Tax=Rhizoctonia solani AG-3 TaxID=1086053 RepID=A0A074RSG7_9AGAM|nr:BTB/POZ domain protein [Rhizoctonia solani AG-3 Rhs1AP]KEP50071.1 BTB/POZ domain protein [Rhizoctonia solani 123E]